MNAIYIGPPRRVAYGVDLCYGTTGRIMSPGNKRGTVCPVFRPDLPWTTYWGVPRRELYVPAEDATRHCPNPISACTL